MIRNRSLIIAFLVSSKAFANIIPLTLSRDRNDMTPSVKEARKLRSKYITNIKTHQKTDNIETDYANTPENTRKRTQFLEKNTNNKKTLSFTKCDESLPEISLENEILYTGSNSTGSLFNIPNEHQDGYETCYANSARNLIISASNGSIKPSFFDVALAYKTHNKDSLAFTGMGHGYTCEAFEAAKAKGVCEDKHSPLENGEAPPLIEFMNLGQPDNDVLKSYYQLEQSGSLVEKMKILGETANYDGPTRPLDRFLTSYSTLHLPDYQKTLGQVERNLIKHFGRHTKDYLRILTELPRDHGNVSYTSLPAFRSSFPNLNTITNHFPLTPGQESEIRSKRAEFEWEMRKLLANDTPQKDFLELKNKYFKNTYDLIPEEHRELLVGDESFLNWLNSLKSSQSFIEQNKASLKFYAQLETILPTSLAQEVRGCADYQLSSFFEMLGSFEKIIIEMEKHGLVPSEILLSKDLGQLANPEEILEALYMPACKENRKPIELTNECIVLDKQSVNQNEMDEIIISRLLKNTALGYNIRGHATTLTGIRFNKETNSCEYLVRDSGEGRSDWINQTKFYNDMVDLEILD
jgi:hypothetical protein